MARKLLLVPVLVVALFVAVLEAPAAPPSGVPAAGRNLGQGVTATPGALSVGFTDHRPAGVGDGRRIK